MYLTRRMRHHLQTIIIFCLVIAVCFNFYLICSEEERVQLDELPGSGKILKLLISAHTKVYSQDIIQQDDIDLFNLTHLELQAKDDIEEKHNDKMAAQAVYNPYDFPNVEKCGDIDVWEEYAAFHNRIVSGEEKGKYLLYNCASQHSCGGWGNRLGGISVAFTLAVITNRALLIRMPLPLDINVILHPKAVMWNHSFDHRLSTKKYFMVDPPELNRYWLTFERMLMKRNSVDVIELHTNLGFFWFMLKFSEQLKQLFNKFFPPSIMEDYRILYGCIQRYLFTYDKIVTDAIQKELSDLGLQPGKFIAAHYRTQLIANDTEPPTPLEPGPHLLCATMAAEALGDKLNLKHIPTYLITDTHIVEDYAHKLYKDKILTSPVKKIHIDRTVLTGKDALAGYVGVFVNIEVATKAAVFLRFGRQHSSMADLIVSLGRDINTVIQCGHDYHHCLNDTSICKQV